MKNHRIITLAGIFTLLTILVVLNGCSKTWPHMGNNTPPNITAAFTHKPGASTPNQAQLQAIVMDFSDV